jgi:glycosyltransferase involved in cell wall biosynthesis
MSRDRPLVIVPAFNEHATIKEVVAQVVALNYEVLVVDDSSTDETADLAASAGASVLRLAVNLGVGGALRAGFRYAIDHGYESVVQIDGDGQHPTHQIADLERAARTFDAHLVIGSRFLSSEATLIPSLTRRLSMWILSKFMTQLAGVPLTDTTSGFRLIQQPLLLRFAEEFPDYYLGDTFEATAIANRTGYRVVEIPAALSPRQFGESSASTFNSILSIIKVLFITLLNVHQTARRRS